MGQCSDPDLFHRIQGQRSILTLLVDRSCIFAGTQGGDLLVWSLDTFDLLHDIRAHRGSLLNLFLSDDGKLLFSSGGDALVNVWCTSKFIRLYSIYSTFDVGDVFCVAYSTNLQTVYLGAQNTCIQWYDFSKKDIGSSLDLTAQSSHRSHRFFDSKGPTGISTPRSDSATDLSALGGKELEISRENIRQYAHYGYVYCLLLTGALNGKGTCTETLISGGGDGNIKLWSLDSSSHAVEDPVCLENEDDSILSLAVDGSLLYAGELGGHVFVWDLDTLQMIRKIKAHSSDALTVAVGYDLLFCGSAEGDAKVGYYPAAKFD